MKGSTKQEASPLEGQSGRFLAERWGLLYREANTLSIDPAALELVDREESRRLRVLPLEVGTDGPVFAVAEPSEERFAAARELAGDNVTFVVVARETLDALLNSKVFDVSSGNRRPTLFRNRPDAPLAEAAPSPSPDATAPDTEERTDEPEPAQAEGESPPPENESHPESRPADAPPEAASEPNSSQPTHGVSEDALDSLLNQLTAGTGSLRTQIEELTASLEATQTELRETNEQLAEAHRSHEAHDSVVEALNREVADLKADLTRSKSVNESMTARVQEVVQALMSPDQDGSLAR
ncbi:MAG TPA: hypothetical protein VGM80_16985 [Gaiellaceae bacterium]